MEKPIRPSLLSRSAACERLGVSLSTLKHLIAKRQIIQVNIGRRRLIPEDALDRFINEHLTTVEA